MVVPDFELICEIMLVAEGFLDARLLARKFITLYTLCKELLSKQVRAGERAGSRRSRVRGLRSEPGWLSAPPGRAPPSWTPGPPRARAPALGGAHPAPSLRTTTTGACGPLSPCWWWPAPSRGATPAAQRTRC